MTPLLQCRAFAGGGLGRTRKNVKSRYQCDLTESCYTAASQLLPLDQILSMVKVKMADTRNTTLPEMRSYAIQMYLRAFDYKSVSRAW